MSEKEKKEYETCLNQLAGGKILLNVCVSLWNHFSLDRCFLCIIYYSVQ